MGCGCGSGGGSSQSSPRQQFLRPTPTITPPDDCPYTLEMIQGWLTQVLCFKDNGLYVGTSITKRQLNIYIGVLLSAQNYASNICYLQSRLDDIRSFIMVLQSTGQCQS